jgi:hypothetical protein
MHIHPNLAASDVPPATCDYYIDGYTCRDEIPFWDSGALGLMHLGDFRQQPADPYNGYEPVDNSAAVSAFASRSELCGTR